MFRCKKKKRPDPLDAQEYYEWLRSLDSDEQIEAEIMNLTALERQLLEKEIALHEKQEVGADHNFSMWFN